MVCNGSMTRRFPKRTPLLAAATAVAAHLGLVAALLIVKPYRLPDRAQLAAPVFATLVEPPPLITPPPALRPEPETADDEPAPAAPAQAVRPAPVRTPPKPRIARAAPPTEVEPLPGGPPPGDPSVVLGEAALSGARTAGSGSGSGGSGSGGGGQCDMVERLQKALRDDPEVRAAAGQAHRAVGAGGKAILVWNGEWLRSPGQDGKGLAGIRQAIALEVAFAPAACRAEPMHGLVLIDFDDRPGGARLALGSGAWRWSDLLAARRRP